MLGYTRAAVGLLLTTSLLSSALAKPEPNTLGFKFGKKRSAQAQDASTIARKRQDGTFTSELTNYGVLYLINVTVGTPPQQFGFQIDTGSSDLWMPWAGSDICIEDAEDYCPYGAYNENASSTYQEARDLGEFFITYGDGSSVDGIYFNDTLRIGSTNIDGATMALGVVFSQGLGVMGIGFTENESSNDPSRVRLGLPDAFTYPSIVDNLVSQGHITSRTYSLWLDNLDDNVGTILFGGVDSDKYNGDLIALPIQPDADGGTRTFSIAWTGLTIDTGAAPDTALSFSPSQPLPVILDSGSTLTYLPDDIIENIFNGLGVTSDPDIGDYLPCTIAANNITLTYTFGGTDGARITVPLSELLFPLIDYSNEPITTDANGPQICQIGLIAAGDGPLVFGDTFLRSAYVVYDLENRQIALAQTNFRAEASGGGAQVSAISSAAGIPDVGSTATAASVAQTYTGDDPLNTNGGGSATRTSADTAFGSDTVSRSATFRLSTSGTVAASALETAPGSSARQSGSGTGSASATGSSTASGASASSTNAGARVGGAVAGSMYRDVVVGGLVALVLSGWGWALLR